MNRFTQALYLLAAGSLAAAELDHTLTAVLKSAGFTGTVGQSLEKKLGRPLNPALADLGRLKFFDPSGGLRNDNACAGCHSPAAGFGDSQPMAIGVLNNGVVGADRSGPRNQRRTPTIVNTTFFPKLMWNGRFFAPSGDPFDSSKGFTFPDPEGTTRFPAKDPAFYHLLVAQAHIPPTELVEVAGFRGTQGTIDPIFDQFDDGRGDAVPPPDKDGFRNEAIRAEVLKRLNGNAQYRRLFGFVFPKVASGGPIDFAMFGQAVAEFEFSMTFADAPIDRFARGQISAMRDSEKRGALLFFGKAGCVSCHAVAGQSNEMFSDFDNHNIGIPQVAPAFSRNTGNVVFDGPNQDEDFGLAQITGKDEDRYKFRTSPLRNVALQPAFFHNGAFTRLPDAIRHHLNVAWSNRYYNPLLGGVAPDLLWRRGPIQPVLAALDPKIKPVDLDSDEFDDLVTFVAGGLLDQRASANGLCAVVPGFVPSGLPVHRFQGCGQ